MATWVRTVGNFFSTNFQDDGGHETFYYKDADAQNYTKPNPSQDFFGIIFGVFNCISKACIYQHPPYIL